MGLSNWPTFTDDGGDKTSGTILNKSVFDDIKASIEDDLFSDANPSITAENAIDEVVTARGSKDSLSEFLLVAHNADGTLQDIAGQASTTQLAAIAGQNNWVLNDDLLLWAGGDAAAPTCYALSGAGATIARTGSGLGDTNTKIGPFSAKVTRAAADVKLSQYLLNATSFANAPHLKGATFTVGAWVKTSVANHARISVGDGVGTSESDYHAGDGAWEFLAVTHTLSGSATYLQVRFEVNNSSGDAYVSGITALPGTIELTGYVPTQKNFVDRTTDIEGAVAVADNQGRGYVHFPALLRQVVLSVVTAPAGSALIVDIDIYNGGWNSAFSTKPQIDDGASAGSAEPDGTYAYRCFPGATILGYRVNVDQIGSGTAGSNLFVTLTYEQYITPQATLRDMADIGST